MTRLASPNSTPAMRWHKPLWAAAAALLLVPLVAMAFTREMAWGPGDFLLATVLLGSACGAYELAVRALSRVRDRLIAVGVIVTAVLVVWAELAIGIFS